MEDKEESTYLSTVFRALIEFGFERDLSPIPRIVLDILEMLRLFGLKCALWADQQYQVGKGS